MIPVTVKTYKLPVSGIFLYVIRQRAKLLGKKLC